MTRDTISQYQPLGGYWNHTLHQFPNFLLGPTPIWAVSLEHKPGDKAMQGVDHWIKHENKMKPKSISLQQTCFQRVNWEWLWLIHAQRAGWSGLVIVVLHCLLQHFIALTGFRFWCTRLKIAHMHNQMSRFITCIMLIVWVNWKSLSSR